MEIRRIHDGESCTYLLWNRTVFSVISCKNSTGYWNSTTKNNYITVTDSYPFVETKGQDTILIFNRTGSTTWTPPSGVTNVTYLVVAGGGEGGAGGMVPVQGHNMWMAGGGGGAGGLLNGSAWPVVGTQTIVVGAAGSGSFLAKRGKGRGFIVWQCYQ